MPSRSGGKPTRLAACEPCRQTKLACDHVRPVCSRCRQRGQAQFCLYRERPFKKRHKKRDALINTSLPAQTPVSIAITSAAHSTDEETTVPNYPNTGYLGLPSSAVIFDRLPDNREVDAASPACPEVSAPISDKVIIEQGNFLQDLFQLIDGGAVHSLIQFWLAKGTTLCVGGPFVESCVLSLRRLLAAELFEIHNVSALARKLSNASLCSIEFPSTSTITQLKQSISDANIKWESIVLALIAIGIATTDISFFPHLYITLAELLTFRKAVTKLADRCLEIVLELDCHNDIQLVCQYEIFILHSIVDGDQSYVTWRLLGDAISSLLFLGYNEKLVDACAQPESVGELRRTIFAQIYADDKNMAVFLGRPPRLSRNFCLFHLPGNHVNEDRQAGRSKFPMGALDDVFFGDSSQSGRITGLRWKACCASLKEEILETLQTPHQRDNDVLIRRSAIQARAETLWQSLPTNLKLMRTLRPFEHRSPFDNDFLLDMRLTYLQILFLLKSSGVTDEHNDANSTTIELLEICQEMLALVVEAIVLRNHLVNSGTSLLWKVVHYGLPAAGAICISILRPSFWHLSRRSEVPKTLQDLSVFASELGLGAFLCRSAPNYNLLCRAAYTIQGLLAQAFSFSGMDYGAESTIALSGNLDQPEVVTLADDSRTEAPVFPDLWAYEVGFWQDLGAHFSVDTSFVP